MVLVGLPRCSLHWPCPRHRHQRVPARLRVFANKLFDQDQKDDEILNIGEKRSYHQMAQQAQHMPNRNLIQSRNPNATQPLGSSGQEGVYDDKFDEIEDYELA